MGKQRKMCVGFELSPGAFLSVKAHLSAETIKFSSTDIACFDSNDM